MTQPQPRQRPLPLLLPSELPRLLLPGRCRVLQLGVVAGTGAVMMTDVAKADVADAQ